MVAVGEDGVMVSHLGKPQGRWQGMVEVFPKSWEKAWCFCTEHKDCKAGRGPMFC